MKRQLKSVCDLVCTCRRGHEWSACSGLACGARGAVRAVRRSPRREGRGRRRAAAAAAAQAARPEAPPQQRAPTCQAAPHPSREQPHAACLRLEAPRRQPRRRPRRRLRCGTRAPLAASGRGGAGRSARGRAGWLRSSPAGTRPAVTSRLRLGLPRAQWAGSGGCCVVGGKAASLPQQQVGRMEERGEHEAHATALPTVRPGQQHGQRQVHHYAAQRNLLRMWIRVRVMSARSTCGWPVADSLGQA